MNATLTIGTARDGATARHRLTEGEAQECASLTCRQRRRDFRAGRLAVRRALEGRASDVAVSAARCAGRAVAVAAPATCRVGVGLEQAGSISLQAIRAHLTDFEARRAQDLDAAIVWAVKKAARKAVGLGDSVPLRGLELCPGPSGKLVGVYVGAALLHMHVQITEPWPGFVMATVWMQGGSA